MATKKQAELAASKFNATIEKSDYDSYSQSYIIEAIAPDGSRWSEGPTMLIERYFTYADKAASAYDDLIERMNFGIEKITDND